MDAVGMTGAEPSPWSTPEGLRAVVTGLVPREPVVDPAPMPTPAAALDDLSSLVLQEADLPGRYGYGDGKVAALR
jgi:hypothetical protein